MAKDDIHKHTAGRIRNNIQYPQLSGDGQLQIIPSRFSFPGKKQTGNETSVSSGPRVCTLVVFILF